MLKLKRSFFDNPVARQALVKLSTTQMLPADIAYRVGRICTRVDKEMQITRDKVMPLLKAHMVLNEKGEPKGIETGSFEAKSAEDEKAHDEAFKLIMEEEFEEKVNKIPLSALKHVGLTPVELIAIDDIIDHSGLVLDGIPSGVN